MAKPGPAPDGDRMLQGFRVLSGLLDNRFSLPFLPAPFGLDASDPAFWQKGLGLIERMIDELEGLS